MARNRARSWSLGPLLVIALALTAGACRESSETGAAGVPREVSASTELVEAEILLPVTFWPVELSPPRIDPFSSSGELPSLHPRVVREILEQRMGIDFPPGTMASYLEYEEVLWLRHRPEAITAIHDTIRAWHRTQAREQRGGADLIVTLLASGAADAAALAFSPVQVRPGETSTLAMGGGKEAWEITITPSSSDQAAALHLTLSGRLPDGAKIETEVELDRGGEQRITGVGGSQVLLLRAAE